MGKHPHSGSSGSAFVLFLALILLSANPLFAQDPHLVDSFTVQLNEAANDTDRVFWNFRLAWIHLSANTDEAERYTDQASELAKVLNDSSTFARVNHYYGLINRLNGDYNEAIGYFEKALKIYEDLGNEINTTGPIFNLAVVYKSLGDYDKSLRYYYRELEINERIGTEAAVANTLNSIGIVNRRMKAYDDAKDKLDRALEIFTKLDDKWNMANVLSNLGNVCNDQNENNKAIDYYRKALALDTEINDTWGIGYQHHNIGEVFSLMNELDSAEFHLLKALKIREDLGHKTEMSETYAALGSMYLNKRNLIKSEAYLIKSAALAEEIEALESASTTYAKLSDLYAEKGNYRKALDYEQLYVASRDSLLNEERVRLSQDLEARYQSEKKDRLLAEQKLEIQKKEENIRRQRLINYGILGGALALLLVLFFAFNSLMQKRKLEQQKFENLKKDQELMGIKAMMNGEEKERTRIAKDLHDGLNGLLAGVKLRFDSIRKKQVVLQTDSNYVEALASLDEASREVRRIAHNMMPELLHKHGLIKALEEYFSNIRASKVLKIEFHHNGMSDRLARDVELVVYRILQELIHNIMKHAKASEAFVQISKLDELLTVTIEDDGKGFDISQISDGAGLESIRSRVDTVSGNLDIQSQEGKGTSVYIEIALTK